MSDFTCSVGLGGAIDKNGAARHDLLPRGQAGENLDHAITASSRADLAQCQGIALSRNPNADAIAFVEDCLLRHRRVGRRLPVMMLKSANIPGFSAPSGFSTSARTGRR